MVYKLSEIGFDVVGYISFEDIYSSIGEVLKILKSSSFNNSKKLIEGLENLTFQYLKKGSIDIDNDDNQLIVPCDAIKMSYSFSLAHAFDEFTKNNLPKSGYVEVIALGQLLGSLVGHYEIRERGGGDIFFVVR